LPRARTSSFGGGTESDLHKRTVLD